MKLQIKTKRLSENVSLPKIIDKGDWIDLQLAQEATFSAPHAQSIHDAQQGKRNSNRYRNVVFDFQLLPLGIAMQLPKGYEAIVLPRSSTFKNRGIILANSMGVIDNTYCGDNDEWRFPAIALKDTTIPAGEKGRICQFRIQLSQKATLWQKLKWLFTSGIELVEVDHLGNEDRKGIGEGTGA